MTRMLELFSTNGVFSGKKCRNSGITRQTFAGDQVVEWQEYTDSKFFEEMHAGWREVVGPELGAHLSRYGRKGPPWYPYLAENEWPLETSVSDGRSAVPEAMRGCLEAVVEFWKAPRSAPRDLFADEVDVHFQGCSWPLGGHHRGRAGIERLFEVARRIWPEPSEIVKTEFWANQDELLRRGPRRLARGDRTRARSGAAQLEATGRGEVPRPDGARMIQTTQGPLQREMGN